jgi:hypothetical protein
MELFNEEERRQVMSLLENTSLRTNTRISIKKLLTIIETARQDVDKVDKFISKLCGL